MPSSGRKWLQKMIFLWLISLCILPPPTIIPTMKVFLYCMIIPFTYVQFLLSSCSKLHVCMHISIWTTMFNSKSCKLVILWVHGLNFESMTLPMSLAASSGALYFQKNAMLSLLKISMYRWTWTYIWDIRGMLQAIYGKN